MKQPKSNEAEHTSLGDYIFPKISFRDIDKVFTNFTKEEFKHKTARERFRCVNKALLFLIQEAPAESFLLPAVIQFIDRVNKEHILKDLYNFSVFEFWLNQFSEISEEENYHVRGKIAGKYIPRDEYQALFPIGMGKVFSGTHFVAAHLSPDVDTMVASFWGWLDAFSARVGTAQHLWSLPGGPPDSPVVLAFEQFFGPIFSYVPSSSNSMTLAAIDLVTQKGFVKKKSSSTISVLDNGSGDKAVILIDENGHYEGEWHRSDADPIRQIIIRFKSCLRWFENNLHVRLISLFAKKKLNVKDIPDFISSVFDVAILDSEPVKEFFEKQKRDLNEFFLKVLEMPKGIASSYGELLHALSKLSVEGVEEFQKELTQLAHSDLFDSSGYLKEDRPAIFNYLERIINHLDNAIHYVRDYAERLDVAINIKNKVFETPPSYVTLRSNIEDIRIKMQKREYLTVIIPEDREKLFPLGVVWASSLQKPILGTVTFRDFCNQEEVKMASYLAPISVIDHHKASLKTNSPPLALISDTQSCNVLLAEQAFAVNDLYALGGMTEKAIKEQLQQLQEQEHHKLSNVRLQQRLLRQRIAIDHRGKFFVHPDREISEYLCYLLAILDDTDLLTKVSKRDVECVIQLLNRLKTLTLKKNVEIINVDDLSRDQHFAQAAAKRILKHPEMYSLYRKVYESKELEIEKNLTSVLQEDYENLFVDTKEQNGCCRVGQTKLFSINVPAFQKTLPKLLSYWHKVAEEVTQAHPEIDLHLHMISTIPSATEVYEDKVGHYTHQDELWFWVPSTQKAYDHLSSFLTGFQAGQKLGSNVSIEFLQPDERLRQAFISNWSDLSVREKTKKLPDLPIAILRFDAGLLNSRKAMITPYLPRLI